MSVNSGKSSEITPGTNTDSDDTAADNLDYLIDLLSEHDDLMKDVSELCYSFVEDMSKSGRNKWTYNIYSASSYTKDFK